nr:hypothetical protein [Roseburia sp.]
MKKSIKKSIQKPLFILFSMLILTAPLLHSFDHNVQVTAYIHKDIDN